MKILDAHPIVTVVYFVFALVCVCISFNLVVLVSYFIALFLLKLALEPNTKLDGALKALLGYATVVLFIALLNCLFSHTGDVVLVSLGPIHIYRESLLFGVCMGCMLSCMILLFDCFGKLICADDVLSFSGGVFPNASVMLSVSLSLVPQLVSRSREMRETRFAFKMCSTKTRDIQHKLNSAKGYARHLTALMSYTAEGCVTRSRSMRSRGWGVARTNGGLVRRSAYRRRSIAPIDVLFCVIVAFFGVLACAFAFMISNETSEYVFAPFYSFWPFYLLIVCYALIPLAAIFAQKCFWRGC